MGTINEDLITSNQIKALAEVHISPDLIDKIDIKFVSDKAINIVDNLEKNKISLNEITDQEWYEFWKRWGGQNDKKIANAEKAIIDATKFNVGLSCLLVLFSKAIKAQQDKLIEHTQSIDENVDKIQKLQGLTKEQAEKIVELLTADEYLMKQLKNLKEEILKVIENNASILRIENQGREKQLIEEQNSKREVLAKNINELIEKFKIRMEESEQLYSSKLIEVSSDFQRKIYWIWSGVVVIIASNVLLWFFK